jgi:hypothetical protein
MSRKHRARVDVEGLESRVALSSIAPTVGIHHHPFGAGIRPLAEIRHLHGAVKGTYVTVPGGATTPTPPSIQLHGGGYVSPLGVVSVDGMITANGGQLTLVGPQSNATETVLLHATNVVTTGTDTIETFSYNTADGQFGGTFTLDLHSTATASLPSQMGTFDATFS